MKIQATSVELNGRAYVIIGESAAGKSTLALALINRGAKLIADDVTEIRENTAYAPQAYQGWLEVRGVGLDMPRKHIRVGWRFAESVLYPVSPFVHQPKLGQ